MKSTKIVTNVLKLLQNVLMDSINVKLIAFMKENYVMLSGKKSIHHSEQNLHLTF